MSQRIASRRQRVLGVVVLGLLLPTAALSAPGGLDTTFSGDGKLTDDVGTHDNGAAAVVTLANGSIVTAGNARIEGQRDIAMTKYTENGTPDDDFGDGGEVAFGLTADADEFGEDLVRSGTKFVVVGTSALDSGDAFIARRLGDGSPDLSFGTSDGALVESFGGDDGFLAVARQSDGKFVAGGYVCEESCDFLIARFNADGSLDTNLDDDPAVHFSQNGWTQTDFGFGTDQIFDLAIQADGRIVAVGEALTENNEGLEFNFAVARYHPNGQLDQNFSGDGLRPIDLGDDDEANAVALLDNRILVGGSAESTTEPQFNDFAFVQLKGNGAFDDNFSGDGKRKVVLNGEHGNMNDLAIQSDGRIVGVGSPGFPDVRFAVVRLLASGKLDANFGSDGVKKTQIGVDDAQARAVAIDSDDRIVVAGHTEDESELHDIALARFKSK